MGKQLYPFPLTCNCNLAFPSVIIVNHKPFKCFLNILSQLTIVKKKSDSVEFITYIELKYGQE